MPWYRLFTSRIQILTLMLWQSGPLAALISLQTLQDALHTFGYPAVTLFIMIESMGVPFPGETMLLLASFYAAIDHQLQIPIIIACAAAGAIIGDNLGFYIGRTGGRAFIERFGRFFFLKPRHLERAERFFAKHGNKTVFLGRFIAILRTWAAFLAGVNRMRWRTFLIYNAAGGIVWATIFGTIGYLAGRLLHDNFNQVERLARTAGWIGTAVIIIGVLLLFIFYRRHRLFRFLTKKQTNAEKSEEASESTKITPANAGEVSESTEATPVETSVKNETTANQTQEFIEGDRKGSPL